MNRRNEVCLLIIKTLRKAKTPLSAYRIAQLTKRHKNLVTYHLGKLKKDMLIEQYEGGYVLIPILYDVQLIDAIYASLIPFVNDTARSCKSPKQVLSVLQISLELFLSDLDPKEVLDKNS